MSTHDARLAKLYELGRRRQMEVPPKGCKRISDFHDGAYESDFVSPYSKSAGNTAAKVFIVLQDWASVKYLDSLHPDTELIEFGMKPSLPTNVNLRRLLRETFSIDLSDTFATNAFPFAKPGIMSANVGPLVDCIDRYVLPQIEIVEPQLVVCLGLAVFNAVAIVLGEARRNRICEAIGTPVERVERSFWCQAHTGTLGAMNRRRSTGFDNAVENDWQLMTQVGDFSADGV